MSQSELSIIELEAIRNRLPFAYALEFNDYFPGDLKFG